MYAVDGPVDMFEALSGFSPFVVHSAKCVGFFAVAGVVFGA
jgi:hypothetical protein